METNRCPECGRDFDLQDASTYTTKPPLLVWRFWAPAFTLAVIGSLIGAAAAMSMGNWGWSLWFAVPFTGGALLGYRFRSHGLILGLLITAYIIAMLMTAISLGFAGFYCGVILAGLIVGPVLLGTILGVVLRFILKRTSFSQRAHFPVIGLILMPGICAYIEGSSPKHAVERITTSSIIPAGSDACWDAIVFYEEVTHRPPLILRIGLAHPLFASGDSQRIGDIKRCVYNKGHIVKRITKSVPSRLLAFEVLEQRIGYENDVRLIGGSFEFQPLTPNRTRVTLTTEYQPLLSPRFAWRWGERYAIHTLHRHVLEGMRLRVDDSPQSTILVQSSENADHH